jgi:hypothetical protein
LSARTGQLTDGFLALVVEPEPGGRLVRVDRDALVSLHSTLSVDARFQDFELVILQAAAADIDVEPFALRVGDWQIDMPQRLLQSATATAVLAAAIAADGLSSIPVAVLAVVLPFLLDIERVELRSRDRIVLAWLRDVDLAGGDPESAYGRLPEDLRLQLTLLEFADVWDRLIAAGEIDPHTPASRAVPRRMVLTLPDHSPPDECSDDQPQPRDAT